MIKGLHHSAYRCRDSEATRNFYEDFLGLRLVGSLAIKDSPRSAKADVLHTFFQMNDGSCLAFFEAPAMPFEFKRQLDFDLHIALEVDMPTLHAMFAKGKERGIKPAASPTTAWFIRFISETPTAMSSSSPPKRRHMTT